MILELSIITFFLIILYLLALSITKKFTDYLLKRRFKKHGERYKFKRRSELGRSAEVNHRIEQPWTSEIPRTLIEPTNISGSLSDSGRVEVIEQKPSRLKNLIKKLKK